MRRDGGADAAPREGRPATAAEDWPRIREVLRAALERGPAQRTAFLDEACGADAALRRSVEALLAAHEEAGDFLEAPSELDRLAASVLGDEGAPALAAGSRVGRYEILELLDAGGMGEVYRARDTGLGRDVAVKVMRPWMTRDTARLRLFEKEARAAGAISDPNILAVFDVGAANGMPYVVSELLEGETLGARLRRSSLTVRESVEYGIQIAQGLCAAHEKGIVHRDLKPENVFLTRQGRLKLLDFGLAKLLHDPREDAAPAALSSSSGSGLMGTPGYIAPERLEGQPSDRRVDIFALGAILYRMLAGRPAFGSENTVGELSATLTEEPAPFAPEANVPARVQRVVWRCLQKRPEHRFQSAHEVRSALQDVAGSPSSARPRWALAAVAALAALLGATVFFGRGRSEREPSEAALHRRIRSLAVLPLENASGDPEQQYFADGMTEALVAEMARTDGLRVLSRDSAAALQDRATRAEIARQLRVDAVVQGSVRRTGSQVRVAVELVRAANDEPVWAGTYDRDVRDVFALHHDVAGAISSEIALVAHPAREHAVHAEARSVEAYEAYLRGRFYWNLRSTEAAPKAIAQFNRALELDPLYAEAYIGLADTYAILGDMDAMPHADAYARAEAAARRALDLDPTRAEGYASLGHLRMHAWRWEEADRLFRRALELDPGYATALQWRSYNLASMGRTSEAVDAIARAQQLDPLSVIINTDMAQILYFARRYEDALAECRKTLQMNPAFAEARRVSFLVLQRVHRDAEALADLETYRGLPDGGPGGSVGYAYAALGRAGEAAAVLRELDTESRRRFVASYDFAVIHAGLGEADQALAWLDKSLTRHDPETMILPADPRFDSLRGDPRFVALLERMSLPRP